MFQYISIDRSLGSIDRKSCLTFFNWNLQLSPKCFNWFWFLIYLRYIRETLARFLCYSYCGLCESLVRSLKRFPSHKLRVFKEKNFLHLDNHSSCCHWSLKKHKRVCLYLVVNPRKRESVDSKLARGRVSKFYW